MSILVIAIAMGVIQLAVALHVRNMLISAASEGARLAATNDRGLDDGVERTESLLSSRLAGYDVQVHGERHRRSTVPPPWRSR